MAAQDKQEYAIKQIGYVLFVVYRCIREKSYGKPFPLYLPQPRVRRIPSNVAVIGVSVGVKLQTMWAIGDPRHPLCVLG